MTIDVRGELGRNRDVDIGIVADAGAFLEQMTTAMTTNTKAFGWLTKLREIEDQRHEDAKANMFSDDVPISARAIHPKQPGHWMDPGTLGVGTPFAIATKVARPDKEVVILFGDGAFGCTGFDYDTLIRFELPVVGIISNNAAWNQIRFGQIDKYGRERGDVANLLNPTRYDKIVEAMGGYGEHVTEPGDIRPALERARESGQPTLVNIMVDPDVFKRRHDAADDVPIVPHSRHVQVAIRPLCA